MNVNTASCLSIHLVSQIFFNPRFPGLRAWLSCISSSKVCNLAAESRKKLDKEDIMPIAFLILAIEQASLIAKFSLWFAQWLKIVRGWIWEVQAWTPLNFPLMLQDPSKACPRQLVKSRSSLPSFCVIVRARFSPLRPTTSTNLIKSSSILNSLVLKYLMQIVSYCLTDKSVICHYCKKLTLLFYSRSFQ